MKTHIVIDGNAFYEVDEDCLNRKKEEKKNKAKKQQRIQAERKKKQNSK